MATFQPPPTYALPILVDEKTGKSSFNPIWLKWFVDLTSQLTPSGGGSGSVTSVNVTGGSGISVSGTPITSSGTIGLTLGAITPTSVAATTFIRPGTPAGAAQTACSLYAGSGAPNNADGANGDYYFRSDGAGGTQIYHKLAGAWGGIV